MAAALPTATCNKAEVKSILAKWNDKSVKDNTIKLTPLAKAFKGAGLNNYILPLESSIFNKHAKGVGKPLPYDTVIDVVIPDLALYVANEEAKQEAKTKKKARSPQTILEELYKKLESGAPKEAKAAPKGKSADVTDRLTDVGGYTGAHKKRFDAETGKGKGIDGREDRVANDGYVDNYKGKGTFDKKH